MNKNKNNKEIKRVNWHSLEMNEVYKMLETDEKGLTASVVELRQKKYGKNSLPAKKVPPMIVIFLKQFLSPLIYVLLAAAFIALLIGDTKDAFFIFLVLLINAVIGTYQEYRAEKSAAALQNIIKVRATVLRDGKKIEIDATELVPGDIVFLEAGFKVPADIRVIEVNSLETDESFLTGESVAVLKKDTVLPENTHTSEKVNMLFAGATITKGRGFGIVVETGINTEVGKIAKTVTEESDTKTPLIIRMEKFSKQISIIVLTCCAIVFFFLVGKGSPMKDVFFLVVALAVSSIPEGLPVSLTVALTVATQRMLKRNVIVRRLTSVESLGSCTYIASDKTGTLTVNQQTAKAILLPWGDILNVSGQGYNSEGQITDNKGKEVNVSEGSVLYRLILSGIICNEASLNKTSDKWSYFGDAMDIAFLSLGYKAGFDSENERAKYKIIDEIPYESEKKYAAKFYELAEKVNVAAKGAVEVILSFCSSMYNDRGELIKIEKQKVENQAMELASKGYRVLAIAGGEVVKTGEAGLTGLILYGLVGFIDPLRPEAIEAVNKCKTAGITVSMVTGDHPLTAFAIAKELGICNSIDEVVSGRELEELGNPDNLEFVNKVSSSRVFARVTPIQKLQIVDALIRAGHFVAVTGDGVNDAPAMKKANIGVAMGSGTDVAKDTSAMIVTDDNFASIVAGVEEGRFAYDNIRKVIYLLISTGAAEIVLFMLSMIFTAKFFASGHIEPPLIAIQLLWLNLVTNGVQAAALAFEGGEDGTMKKPPRSPKEGIFNSLMIKEIVISGIVMALASFGIWYYLLSTGMDAFSARNITLLAMVCLENVHVFNCRSETVSAFKVKISKNYFLVGSVVIAQGIHILSMQIPFMQSLLRIEPVSIKEWIIVASLSFVLLFTMEIFKMINNRYMNKKEKNG